MRISKLGLVNFRNLENSSHDLTSNKIAIIGKNGQGKTNLLEAVHLLSFASSFKTSSNKTIPRWGEKDFKVIGWVEDEGISAELAVSYDGKTRSTTLNGNKTKLADGYIGSFISTIFTPDDHELITGAPVLRRSFLDKTLSLASSNYLRSLIKYNKALKTRNYLISCGETKELEPWNIILANNAKVIFADRLAFSKRVERDLEDFFNRIFKSESTRSTLRYRTKCSVEGDFIETYLWALNDNLRKDVALSRTTFGVHRDDLEFLLAVDNQSLVSARENASRGQSRSLALSLKLASMRFYENVYGKKPVLLLDDIDSELDGIRREVIYSLIKELDLQVIFTTTSLSTVANKVFKDDLQIIKIDKGVVENG